MGDNEFNEGEDQNLLDEAQEEKDFPMGVPDEYDDGDYYGAEQDENAYFAQDTDEYNNFGQDSLFDEDRCEDGGDGDTFDGEVE